MIARSWHRKCKWAVQFQSIRLARCVEGLLLSYCPTLERLIISVFPRVSKMRLIVQRLWATLFAVNMNDKPRWLHQRFAKAYTKGPETRARGVLVDYVATFGLHLRDRVRRRLFFFESKQMLGTMSGRHQKLNINTRRSYLRSRSFCGTEWAQRGWKCDPKNDWQDWNVVTVFRIDIPMFKKVHRRPNIAFIFDSLLELSKCFFRPVSHEFHVSANPKNNQFLTVSSPSVNKPFQVMHTFANRNRSNVYFEVIPFELDTQL